MAYNYPLTPSTPSNTGEQPSLGASRIRSLKLCIQEKLTGLIYGFDTAGTETNNGAKKLPFFSQASDQTEVADGVVVYAKDVSDKSELHVIDENGDVAQMTEGGHIYQKNTLGEQLVSQTAIDNSIADCIDTTRTAISAGATYQAEDNALMVSGSIELQYTALSTYDKDYTYTLSVSSTTSFSSSDVRCTGVITQYKGISPQVSGLGSCTLCALVPKDYYYRIDISSVLINATQRNYLFVSKIA